MKHPTQLIRDMIGHNRDKPDTCPHCGSTNVSHVGRRRSHGGSPGDQSVFDMWECNKCKRDYET